MGYALSLRGHAGLIMEATTRKPVEQVLESLAHRARVGRSQATFISCSTRIDADVIDGEIRYSVNGRPTTKDAAAEAIERARVAWTRKMGL